MSYDDDDEMEPNETPQEPDTTIYDEEEEFEDKGKITTHSQYPKTKKKSKKFKSPQNKQKKKLKKKKK